MHEYVHLHIYEKYIYRHMKIYNTIAYPPVKNYSSNSLSAVKSAHQLKGQRQDILAGCGNRINAVNSYLLSDLH